MVEFGQHLRIEDNRPMEVSPNLFYCSLNFDDVLVLVVVLRLAPFLLFSVMLILSTLLSQFLRVNAKRIVLIIMF